MSVVEPTRAATGPSSPFPKSQALFEAARAVIPGGVTSSVRAGARPHPLYLERGQGPYVWDVDGNRYVDYALGYGPLILGHAPVVVRDAIAPQLERGLTFGSQHRLEPQLAELLVQTVPGADQAIFATTGSEAVAAAIRLARVVTGRDLVIKFEGHYHGWLDGVFASTGVRPRPVRPGGPSRDGPCDPGDPARRVGRRRRRPVERHRLGRADPRRAPVGRRRHPVRARRGQRRPDRGPGRVPRGAPPGRDPFRGAPGVRRGHHRVPRRARGCTGADGRASRPRGVRQGDRRAGSR